LWTPDRSAQSERADAYGGHVSVPPSRPATGRRLLVAVPGAAIAVLVSLLGVLIAGFLGGVLALVGAFAAAVAGAFWGASLVIALGDRAWR
jgi:hypothetical protein